MRIRSVKPDFWSHEKISQLHPETALLALGLLNYSDDEGYFKAHPQLIKSAIFPLRELSRNIPVMLQELSSAEYISLHSAPDGRQIGCVINFLKHQVISHPRKSELKKELRNSDTIPGKLHEDSGTLPSGNGMEWKGNGKGKGKGMDKKKARERARGAGVKPEEQTEPMKSRLLEVGGLLQRQPGTVWMADEIEAFKAAGLEGLAAPDFAAQVAPMQAYYAAKIPSTADFRRRDVLRLLRNWPGELDKARAWCRDHDDGVKKL